MTRLSARVRANRSGSLQLQVFVEFKTVSQLPRLCYAWPQGCQALADRRVVDSTLIGGNPSRLVLLSQLCRHQRVWTVPNSLGTPSAGFLSATMPLVLSFSVLAIMRQRFSVWTLASVSFRKGFVDRLIPAFLAQMATVLIRPDSTRIVRSERLCQ